MRPIRLLRTFGQRHVEILLHQSGEAELPQAQHPRRDHRVENFARAKIHTCGGEDADRNPCLAGRFPCSASAVQSGCRSKLGERIDQIILPVKRSAGSDKAFRNSSADCRPRYRPRRDRIASSRGSSSASCASDAITASPPAAARRSFGRLQILDQLLHRLDRRQRRHRLAQQLHPLPFFGMIKQVLAPRAGLQNVDRRIEPLLDQRTIEMQLHVPGAFEFFEDHFVHAAAGIDQSRRQNRQAAAFLDSCAPRRRNFFGLSSAFASTPPDMVRPLPG